MLNPFRTVFSIFMALALLIEVAMPVRAVADTSCPAGQEFNKSLNRCLTTEQASRVRNAIANCETYPAAERAKCAQNVAAKELDSMESDRIVKEKDSFFKDEEGKLGWGARAGNAAAIAVPLFLLGHNLVKQKKIKESSKGKFKYKCNPPSMILLYGGAGTLLAGEVVSFFGHKKRLKKLYKKNEEFNQKNADGKADATDIQSEAFEVLAENEDSIADVVKTKKGFYAAGTGLFAASAIAAVVEKISLKGLRKSYEAAKAANNVPAQQAAYEKIKSISCSQDELVKTEELSKLNDEALKEEGELQNQVKSKEEELKKIEDNKTKKDDQTQDNHNPQPEVPNKTVYDYHESEDVISAYELMDRILSEYDKDLRHYILVENRADIKKEINELKSISLSRSILEQFIPQAFAEEAEPENKKDPEKENDETIYTLNPKDNNYYDKDGNLAPTLVDPLTGKLRPEQVLPEVQITAPRIKKEDDNKQNLLSQLAEIRKAITTVNGKKVDIGAIEGQVNNQVSKLMGEPVNRAVLAGVIGGWVGVMTAHFHKQQKISEQRADKLREVKETFKSNKGLCTGVDCYGSQGTRTLTPADFDANKKICIAQSGEVDSSCNCRANGTCQSFSGLKLKINPSTLKMMSAVSGPAKDLSLGNFAPGEFDAASIMTNAASAMKAAKKMNLSTEPKASAKKISDFTESAENALASLGNGMSMPGVSGAMSGSSGGAGALPSNPAEAAKKLEEEVINPVKYSQGGKGFGSLAESDALPEFPNFGQENGGPSIEEQQFLIQNMDKQSDYDVNKTKDVSIFETLSNRYRASALKKLMPEGN